VIAIMRHRRHRLALPLLLLVGLFAAGLLYSAIVPRAVASTEPSTAVADPDNAEQVAYGRELFLSNCSTCHGFNAEGGDVADGNQVSGPSLIGVGAASVDFQVGTGRMPLQATGPQAPKRMPQYPDDQVKAMAAYIASLAPGPAIPEDRWLDPAGGDPGAGGEIFRVNCAMCHNFAGSGGALTQGKYAPSLRDVAPTHVYSAMLTGPQSMPVFGDDNITPQQKQDIIAYLDEVTTESSPGGLSLGLLGPVSEGLVGWVVGIGGLIACAVWLGAKSS